MPTPKRKLVFHRDKCTCRYCGVKLINYKGIRKNPKKGVPYPNDMATIDHVIPKSRGGTSDIKNLVACCYSCNVLLANWTVEGVESIKAVFRMKQMRLYELRKERGN